MKADHLEVQRLLRTDMLAVGRLCRANGKKAVCGILDADTDAQDNIITFLLPSRSQHQFIHMVMVSLEFATCACSCWAFKDFRNCTKMPYRDKTGGVWAEHEMKRLGRYLDPLITRPDQFLCPHARKVKAYLKRHGIWPLILQSKLMVIERVATLPPKKRTA